MKVGPIDTYQDDKFTNTVVSSIHRSRTPCLVVKAGQTATLALESVDKSHLRKVSMYVHIFTSSSNLCVHVSVFEPPAIH